MSEIEIPEDIAALARKMGKEFKSEQDLSQLSGSAIALHFGR